MPIDDTEFESRLTAALNKAAELDYMNMPADEELEQIIQPSAKFQRRMRALFKNPSAYVKNQRRPLYMRILRTAAVFFITFTVILGAAMAVSPKVRAAVVDFVRSWFEDRTEYNTRPGIVISGWTFGYIPDGFDLVANTSDEFQIVRVFRNERSETIFINIRTGSGIIDNEHSTFYQTTINGRIADIYDGNAAEDDNIIVLYDDSSGTIMTLTSSIVIDELIKIAENIQN
jgi:hypothetical protein